MKKAILVSSLVALFGPSSVRAQQAHDEYSTRFGGEAGDESEPRPRAPGPRDIAEAKRQGRGYRVGSTADGTQAAGGKDVHVVQDGDTLWDISAHYFGDPWHWPELWSHNPEITNPHWIYPLDQIRLSSDALTQDRTLAKVTSAGPGGGLQEKGATAGVLSGTETAGSVIVPRGAWKPGMIFLRDQGYLDNESLRTAGQIIGGNEEHMLMSPSDQVYVRFGSDKDVQVGQAYTVFRALDQKERAEKEKGTLVRILGTVVVRSYDSSKGTARGVVTEAMDPIERGLRVAKLDRRFDLVTPKANQANVVAHIIASIQPHTLLAFGSVIFLDVGQGHGIEPGNRFFVVRRGDSWLSSLKTSPTAVGNIAEVPAYDPSLLPKEVIAELRVIKVRKATTVAIITRSDVDVAIGDTAEMRTGF
jgi:hypothetical protein